MGRFRKTLYPPRSGKRYSLAIEQATRKIEDTLNEFDSRTQLLILADLMKRKVEGEKIND